MFSIPVSELTPELLKKAEYWKLFKTTCSRPWADVRHRDDLSHAGDDGRYTIIDADCEQGYTSTARCFPVSIFPDGTEVRLECPRMPDEVEIDGPIGDDYDVIKGMDVSGIYNGRWDWYWPRKGTAFCLHSLRPPTPEHNPRLSLEGVWVWSTRR